MTCSRFTDENPTFADIVEARLSRRDMLKGTAALAAASAVPSPLRALEKATALTPPASTLRFKEIAKTLSTTHHVAEGHEVNVLLRWGDALFPDSPKFDPLKQTAESQAKQFGYNNDYIAFLPLPYGSTNSNFGLLFVNHEYTNLRLMFPGITKDTEIEKTTEAMMRVEQEAHGCSIIGVSRQKTGEWKQVLASSYNRRITATTPVKISGPAAGHARLITSDDPTGRTVLGTLGNCAGGITPWGTVLTAEENFNKFFAGTKFPETETRNHVRYGIGEDTAYGWSTYEKRFDVEKEPNEANRFGWIVECDPYDPEFTPIKRTALGRFKHESANTVLTEDGRVVVYSGDDEAFEYVYKFVSKHRFDPINRDNNLNLLDEGTLYAARFEANGTLTWLPLVYDGSGVLAEQNGFNSQADVLIETRYAAELMGATPMDRPEDIEIEPKGGRVYIALTKNSKRVDTNPANTRARNIHGHIIELSPPDGGDHGSVTGFTWDIFLRSGNPAVPDDDAYYITPVSDNGWLSCPDNLAFDARGRLWITTDGQQDTSPFCDGLYGCEVSGKARGSTRLFFSGPTGAEITGPCFTPDGDTLFLAVQHPGDDKDHSFDNPSTRWPDFSVTMPPRPAIITITRKGGGEIGS